MSDVWSFRRVWLLLRNLVISQYGGVLIAIGIISGVYALKYVLQVAFAGNMGIPPEFFFLATVIPTAFIASSLIFSAMHKGDRGISWFMLPASLLEKFAAGWFASSVGLILAALVVFGVTDLLIGGICDLIFGHRQQPFKLFSPVVWTAIGHFFVWQTVFLFGSVRFRRLAFIKTVGWMVIVAISFSLLAPLFGWLLLNPYFEPQGYMMNLAFEGLPINEFFMTSPVLVTLGQILYFAVLPLFFLATAFVRLRETELHHGIR